MPQILRTVLIPDQAQAADGVVSFDLPVNPLSVVLLTVEALNETVALTTYSSITALLNMITDVRIAYRGATIIGGSLSDLSVMFNALSKWPTIQGNKINTDNAVRALTVPLCFGRRPYDPLECFPATRRGDLVLTLTTDVAVVGADALILQAETIELLEATPERFTKVTTTQKTVNAIQEHDVELPIGNDLLGVLLFAQSVPTGAVRTSTIGQLALEVDNVETILAETRWESMRADLSRRLADRHERPHIHHTAAAPGNSTEQQEAFSYIDNYAYLDLDPLIDGMYALKTAGAARVNLRVTSEVANAAADRYLPIELVNIAQAAGGAPA